MQKSIVKNVRVDDYTAEMAIIASHELSQNRDLRLARKTI